MEVKILETAGFYPAMKAMRLPHQSVGDTDFTVGFTMAIGAKDLALARRLIKAGDEHAKALRGIVAWMEIKAPIYWWWDMETYIVGHQRLSSESTMNQECKGLTGEELQKVKGKIPFGREITKVDYFSYQTLRRIWKQRRTHRLPEFKQFIDACRQLPYSNELIFVE